MMLTGTQQEYREVGAYSANDFRIHKMHFIDGKRVKVKRSREIFVKKLDFKNVIVPEETPFTAFSDNGLRYCTAEIKEKSTEVEVQVKEIQDFCCKSITHDEELYYYS